MTEQDGAKKQISSGMEREGVAAGEKDSTRERENERENERKE